MTSPQGPSNNTVKGPNEPSRNAGGGGGLPPPAAHAPATGKVNDSEPKFLAEFNALVADTPIEQIRTYLRWQLIFATEGIALPKAFDDEAFDFYGRKMRGQPEQRARWKRCVQSNSGPWLNREWSRAN